jgi:hypothetical protein
VRSNCKRAFFYEKYADMHFVTPLLLSEDIGNDIFDDGSPTDVCSPVFTRVYPCSPKPAKKVSFPSANRRAECQVQRNVEKDENIIDIAQRNSRINLYRTKVTFAVTQVKV